MHKIIENYALDSFAWWQWMVNGKMEEYIIDGKGDQVGGNVRPKPYKSK